MKKTVIVLLILLFISLIVVCNWQSIKKEKIRELNYLEKIKLKVPEPSGLYFDFKKNVFWTVSDENSTIYKLTPKGKIIGSFTVDGYDLEGITKLNDSVLVAILERSRTVVFISGDGDEIKRFNLNYRGEPNEGLEGIAFNSNDNEFFIMNEKNPGLLITTDTSGNILNETRLNLASDYSGLCFDKNKNELWIISDEAKSIFKCKPDGSLINHYKVNINQIEGISIDFENSKLYIISDPLETLFVFDLP